MWRVGIDTGRVLRAGVGVALAGLLLSGCGLWAEPLPSAPGEALDAGDGYIAESVSPFDTELPAVGKLDAALLDAVQDAATDARGDGVELRLTSGWRSERYQRALLAEAMDEHGSRTEALKWVAEPKDSRHVSGDAVDVGPTDAYDWLGRHGANYGLCLIFANEPWHFELAAEPGHDCPQLREDAANG